MKKTDRKRNMSEKDSVFEKRKKVIYDFICDDLYVPMKAKEIAAVLQVPKEQREDLRAVLDALERVANHRTVISISHRTSARLGRVIQIEAN